MGSNTPSILAAASPARCTRPPISDLLCCRSPWSGYPGKFPGDRGSPIVAHILSGTYSSRAVVRAGRGQGETRPNESRQLVQAAFLENGRDGEIRTLDLLLPKQALYQAKLRPVFTASGRTGRAVKRPQSPRRSNQNMRRDSSLRGTPVFGRRSDPLDGSRRVRSLGGHALAVPDSR